jgi:dienelactone hydrolase
VFDHRSTSDSGTLDMEKMTGSLDSTDQAGMQRRTLLAAGAIGGLAAMVPGAAAARTHSQALSAPTDDKRTMAVTYVAARGKRRGVILFSHGLRSAPKHYARLFDAWCEGGYDIYAPLHVDSAEYPDYETIPQDASWPTRLYDMRAVANLAGQDRFIAAGHSYGAMVALTLGGATPTTPPGFTTESMRDHGAVCVLSLSPPGLIPGLISPEGYSKLAVPALVQTGDRDSFVPEIPWQSHLTAYEQAPGGDKYSLVLDGVDHGFGGLIYDPIMFALNDQRAQLDEANRLSILFLDAFGDQDTKARSRLDKAVGQPGIAHLTRK